MFCIKCGQRLEEDWKICPNCGYPSNQSDDMGDPKNRSRSMDNGVKDRNRGHKFSPTAILCGTFAGVGVLCAVIFGGLMLSNAAEKPVDTIGDYYVTGCEDAVKIRIAPDDESKVLTKLSNGEKVSLIDKEDDGYWKIYISSEDITGYMPDHYLTNEKDAVTEPVTRYINIKDGATLTIRSLPKEDASAVGILERGQKVTLLADMSGDFDYIYAVKSKTYGYVRSSRLSSKKVDKADASSQVVITSQPAAPTQVQPQSQIQTKIFGQAAAPTSHLGQYYVSVQKGYLALRNAKAFDSSNEIGQMNNGDYVWAIETSGTYWYVYSPSLGMYGYTNSSYLSTSPVTRNQTQTPDIPTYQSVYYANVASGYLALRNAQAYDAANEIGKIANGAEVDVLDKSGQYWYVYVPSLGQEGYVNSQYLR